MTANRFDHFAKDLLEAVLEHAGSVTVEREVPPTAAQKIDVWFVPDAARADGRKPLGLLGRMVESPSLIEPFHHTPIVDDVRECVRKALNWNHQLARKPEPLEEPVLWVLSAGRPESALRQFAMKPLDAFPRGVYVGPPALRMRLVVLSELPPERDTLLVRLMGAGAVWDQAMTELRALPEDAYERRHALPAIEIVDSAAGTTIKLDAQSRSLSIDTKQDISIKATGNVNLEATGIVSIKGSMVKLN